MIYNNFELIFYITHVSDEYLHINIYRISSSRFRNIQ